MHYSRDSILPVGADALFAWLVRPGAFERLIPPWAEIDVEMPFRDFVAGAEARLRFKSGPFRREWGLKLREVVPGERIVTEQMSGPWQSFVHTTRIEPVAENRCRLHDEIEYDSKHDELRATFGANHTLERLDRWFAFRHSRLVHDMLRSSLLPHPQRIAITGPTGVIGSALREFLSAQGHTVLPVVRRPTTPGTNEIFWDPQLGQIDSDALDGVDAVVHLAGAGVADARWTPKYKAMIRDSRINGTRTMAEAMAKLDRKPRVFVCASAVGYYGFRAEEICTEDAGPGTNFLAQVCVEWEKAADPARQAGIRVVHPRIGIALTRRGGALKSMLTPFKLGVGGRIGHGRQYMSWISLDDVLGSIAFLIATESLEGAVNVTAPNPVPNREFTAILGQILKRPTMLPVPAFALKLAFGEFAEYLLTGQRVVPAKLEKAGFHFFYPDLTSALRFEMGATTVAAEEITPIGQVNPLAAGVETMPTAGTPGPVPPIARPPKDGDSTAAAP